MNGNDTVPALLESRADGTSRLIARLCLTTPNWDWDPRKALASLPGGAGSSVKAARDRYSELLRPLSAVEPDLKGSLARTVRDAFAPIGAKMRPDMSQEQAGFWASALVLAFADLPHWIVAESFGEAVHIPFEFPNDMEAKVREIAEAKFFKHRQALARLEQCLEAMRGAANPAPRLEDQSEEPLSLEEARELVNGMGGTMRTTLLDMGLGSGAITPEDFELLKAESPLASEPPCDGQAGYAKP